MVLHAKARGNPKVTTYDDAIRVFKLSELSSKDRFCDFGCGHGWVVRWASRKCEFAYGMEAYSKHLRKATQTVKHIENARIIKGDYWKDRLPDANVFYCTNDLDMSFFARLKRLKRHNLRIVTIGPPAVPIKAVKTNGPFFLTKFPFELAKNRGQWYKATLGHEDGSWKQVKRKLGLWLNRDALNYYKQALREQFDNSCKGCNEEIDGNFIILENNTLILNHALQNEFEKILPWELGHLVLMPRKRNKKSEGEYHATDISKLNAKEWQEIQRLLPKILTSMRKVLPKLKKDNIHRIYLVTFNESHDWHLHIHLVPRYKHGRRKGPDLLVGRKLSKKDILGVVSELQKELRRR